MLWIALHLPHLPLQALRWSRPGPEGWAAALPLAVSQAVSNQPRLIAVNRAAAALGLQTGQSVATALSLVAPLIVLPRDVEREAAFVRSVALALGVLTPHVAVEASGVLLEVRATLRLFGGLRRLLRHAEAVARECGAQPRLAVAPNASAAWLLATHGGRHRRSLQRRTCTRRLDPLPVGALGELVALAPRQFELLQMLGIERLDHLRALPPAGLQRRLGVDLHAALARAYGEAPDPRRWIAPPEHFTARCELMQRADSAEVLVHAVEALLPPLGGWLQLRWRAATSLALRLRHESRRERTPDTLLRLQLSTPGRDIQQIALLWRERLQRHVLAAPVYEIALDLEGSAPHGGTPGELLPTAGSNARDHAALLDRLVARLGAERVLRYEPLADHRPECAQRAVAVTTALPAASAAVTTPAVAPLPRPAWLLDPPLPLDCDRHGRPLHGGGPLRLCSRAERIETGWFDGAPARRDYHVAEGADHRLCWVYRERRARAPAAPARCDDPGARAPADGAEGRWFLHGWFG